MNNDNLSQKYQKAYLFLEQRNIYDLRAYGQAFGVQSLTTKNKRALITEIIEIAAKKEPKPAPSEKRVRVGVKPITDEEIEELRTMIKATEEPQQPVRK